MTRKKVSPCTFRFRVNYRLQRVSADPLCSFSTVVTTIRLPIPSSDGATQIAGSHTDVSGYPSTTDAYLRLKSSGVIRAASAILAGFRESARSGFSRRIMYSRTT